MSLNSQIAVIARWTAATAGLLALGACSQWKMPSMPSMDAFSVSGDKVLGVVRPYRVEIVQGNVVTKEQMAQVKTGMSRVQVRDAIGSPLLTDVFHEARWDYVFTIRRQGAAPQNRHIQLTFEGEQLAKIDAPEDLPSETEFIAAIDTTKTKGQAPRMEMTEEERKAIPAPVRQAAATPEPVGPVRDYPPLEARR